MPNEFLNGFQNNIGGVNFNFNSVPDLQPQALRGIIRKQTLPEQNVLRDVIATVPTGEKMFKALIDDAIDTAMTPEVDMNADDPMVGDNYTWQMDAVHEYRQAGKINIELGQQLLSPAGTPQRYAGMMLLQRIMGNIVNALDNRREYNRCMAVQHAHDFNASRKADLSDTNVIHLTDPADKWDNPDVFAGTGKRKVNPFVQLAQAKERFGFIAGVYPDSIVVSPDIYAALETHEEWTNETKAAPVKPGARARIRDMDVFVSLGRQNIGTSVKPKLVPTFRNVCVLAYLSAETISEKQYDINRLEQFTTSDRLYYYVRFWHKSKVTVERSSNFMFIQDILENPFVFDNVASLLA